MKSLRNFLMSLVGAGALFAFSPAAQAGCKIYRGSSGYDVAWRVDGTKVYRGSYGYDVAGRGDGCSHSELALAAMVL